MADYVVYFWLIAGIILILAETIVPGLVVIFLGLAALLVAAGIRFGVLSGWMQIMSSWFFLSLLLIFSLRHFFARFAPGETDIGNMDEDLDAIGKIVSVTKDVHPYDDQGRIVFRGTTWAARCPQTTIKKGAEARLVRRELNLWIVEPVSPSERAKKKEPTCLP